MKKFTFLSGKDQVQVNYLLNDIKSVINDDVLLSDTRRDHNYEIKSDLKEISKIIDNYKYENIKDLEK